MERDGDNCFYCGQPLRNDITYEHLIPKAFYGPNSIDNLVLAHSFCNTIAGILPLFEKFDLRRVLHDLIEELPRRGFHPVKDFFDRDNNKIRKSYLKKLRKKPRYRNRVKRFYKSN